LVKFGQGLPYLGSDALEVGQCGHAGDRPEHEPEQEDGLHLLFLPDHSTGRIGPRCSIVARQRDTGSMTATRAIVAVRVLSKLEYLAVCRSFQLLTLHARGDAAKAFEILVLLPRSPLVVLVR
jgi:hypothetical protein